MKNVRDERTGGERLLALISARQSGPVSYRSATVQLGFTRTSWTADCARATDDRETGRAADGHHVAAFTGLERIAITDISTAALPPTNE